MSAEAADTEVEARSEALSQGEGELGGCVWHLLDFLFDPTA